MPNTLPAQPDALIPDFQPRIYREPGAGEFYADGRMLAAVDTADIPGGKSLVIHEWSSHFRSQGHSTQALQWLRTQGFTHIVANGVGLIEDGVADIATYYWLHMRAKGLVDLLLDDDGDDISDHIGPSAGCA